MAAGEPPRRKRRILLVEDEFLVALDTTATLEALGYDVVGPAGTVETALELARVEAVDGAVLDINLGREKSFPVAALLAERGVPMLFLTGYTRGDTALPEYLAYVPMLAKPLRDGVLAEAVAIFDK